MAGYTKIPKLSAWKSDSSVVLPFEVQIQSFHGSMSYWISMKNKVLVDGLLYATSTFVPSTG